MDIDQIPEGREMDELVAQMVMGYVHESEPWWIHPNGLRTSNDGLPHFSTDLTAAWRVWERLRESGKWCCLTIDSDFDISYQIKLTPFGKGVHEPTIRIDSEFLPFAICRAALQACGA